MTNSGLYALIISFFLFNCLYPASLNGQDSSAENIIAPAESYSNLTLLNGRIWHNRYSNVQGDPYFLSDQFLQGSVYFNGNLYRNIDLRLDIYNDELLLRTPDKPIIMMNKEMVDSFDLFIDNGSHHFVNAGNDKSANLNGYVHVLYNGSSALYVKYYKVIYPLAAEGRYDLFQQEHRIFLRTPSGIVPVKRKKELLRLLGKGEKEINDFMRRNRIRVNWKNPGTFVPLAKYFDSER